VKKKTSARNNPASRPAPAKKSASAKQSAPAKKSAPGKNSPVGKKPAPRKQASPTPPKNEGFWTMRLYVAGQSPRSISAIANLRRICEQHVPGRYEVEIIDLIRNPERAKADQIVAIPTLIKKLPIPVGRIIGDLSATDRVMVSLELTSS
jgi:circadian clock protein KaiB